MVGDDGGGVEPLEPGGDDGGEGGCRVTGEEEEEEVGEVRG